MQNNVWVHCNVCYIRGTQSPDQFYLAKCGHIHCSKCGQEAARTKSCLKCKNQVSLVALNKRTPSSVAQFFKPIDVGFRSLIKIIKFQTTNRIALDKYLQEKSNHLKKEYKRLIEAYKAQILHNKRLTQMIETEKSKRQQSSRYRNVPPTDPFGNISMAWSNNVSEMSNPHQNPNQLSFSSFHGALNTSRRQGDTRDSTYSGISQFNLNPKY